jgi:hypothetical protein
VALVQYDHVERVKEQLWVLWVLSGLVLVVGMTAVLEAGPGRCLWDTVLYADVTAAWSWATVRALVRAADADHLTVDDEEAPSFAVGPVEGSDHLLSVFALALGNERLFA